MMAWTQAGTGLLAPTLLEYEVTAILRKAIVARWLMDDLARQALAQILALEIRCLAPTPDLHERALHWADRLGHGKACDAHYLAVAEQAGAVRWTADRRLAQGAQQAGARWVHWIGDGATGP
jgi:predicted nucleic acid-binding protein